MIVSLKENTDGEQRGLWHTRGLLVLSQANASQKKTTAGNQRSIRILQLGNLAFILLHAISNHLLGRKHFSVTALLLTLPGLICSILLARWGKPTFSDKGQVLSSGEDLSGEGGLIEHMWDIVYITWICLTMTGFFGGILWWMFIIVGGVFRKSDADTLKVPSFAIFKVASFVIPYLMPAAGRMRDAMSSQPNTGEPAESNRQQKLRQRQQKGQPTKRR